MTREEKSLVIDNLTAQLAENNVIYVTDLTGLNAQDTSALRRACFKANIKLAVVKNTLLAKAMEASEKEFGELPNILKGNSSLMYAEVGNAPAKLIKEFRKKSDALVAIKSKNEVIGDIIGLLQSPAKNVVSALKSGGGKLAGIIKTLSEK